MLKLRRFVGLSLLALSFIAGMSATVLIMGIRDTLFNTILNYVGIAGIILGFVASLIIRKYPESDVFGGAGITTSSKL